MNDSQEPGRSIATVVIAVACVVFLIVVASVSIRPT